MVGSVRIFLMKRFKCAFKHFVAPVFLFCLLCSPSLWAMPSYTLEQIVAMATERSAFIQAYKAREEASVAALLTAGTYANPSIEMGAGPTRYRTPGGQGNNGNWGIAITQPIDFPNVLRAKKDVAEKQTKTSVLATEVVQIDVRIKAKSAFYEVIQRDAMLRLAEMDRNLLKDIQAKVKLRVQVGEAPRYELIKADTEMLAAERDYQAAKVKVTESKAYLRGLLGDSIPEDFNLSGTLPLKERLPDIAQLRDKMKQTPQLQQINAVLEGLEANLKLQEQLRNPGFSVRAAFDQDPDLQQFRFGVTIPLPLWDHRRGAIAQASAEIKEMQALASDKERSIKRDIEAAYQRYLIAQQQVTAFEGDLLNQADAALKVAESAYRFGERGILDYLDAQRTQRAVRRDYQNVRFEYIKTLLEIEQLLGYEFLEIKQ